MCLNLGLTLCEIDLAWAARRFSERIGAAFWRMTPADFLGLEGARLEDN